MKERQPQPRPLQEAIAAVEAKRSRAAAELAGADAELKALIRLQRAMLADVMAIGGEEGLHGEHFSGTIPDMHEQSLGVRIASGRRKQSESRKAQLAAGMTDQDVADLLKVPRSTVCKWHLGTTRIPSAHADRLAKKGIPRSSWSKIAE